MNSLYNLALRQFSAIQSDISQLDNGQDPSAALQGQITASLSALSKTIDDYESLAKKELIQAKQEKALTRVAKFKEDYKELKNQLSRLKQRASNRTNEPNAQSNSQGIGISSSYAGSSVRSPTIANSVAESPFSLHARGSSTAASPYSQTHNTSVNDPLSAYRMNASAAAMFGGSNGGGFSARENHALREHSFIEQTESQLDAFIAQGREVFGNLIEQRGILKGTQRRLRDAANTMGLSRDVIGYIERRTTQDNLIFAAGVIFTLVCFYYILKWFG
ncbi:hypothetical protein IE53DRAFT_48081 [Violaceomyces palustris]|uniref:Uncharacterized protein n=1 Tax=Violaceomyces palustris TaxID=1673888 RepID=A0ACD0P034_9BASI|nr:hypothetical protein IE53DRAFT_48081 [Violaceomyces palustris]